MMRVIERVLNLRRGDFGRGALLFSYLFLVITSYVAARVARDALFLDQFRASQLPFVDIAIAVLVGFVAAGYMRIARKLSPQVLFAGSLLLFAANSFVFWYLIHNYHLRWLFPIFYVWVGIFGVVSPAQVWTLANYVLTTREAKRLFGLIGAGGIFGGIWGGYVCKSLPKVAGTESLMLVMAALLSLAAVPVVVLARSAAATREDVSAKTSAGEESTPNVLQSLNLIWRSKYLRAIALLILLSSYATTMTGWQFKAIAKHFLGNKDALAQFFGSFYFYAGILCLLFQLLLTGRVLRRFGIGVALVVVPVALLLSSVGVLIWGTLAAVFVLKGSDQVLRYSLDRSTVELLYLPVEPRVKLQVKPFIDTVIWRSGDGLAGLLVLFFATYLHVTTPHMSWVSLGLLTAWLAAAVVARREYVSTLRDSVHQHRLDTERASAPVLDRSTTEIFAAGFHATDPKEILYALDLFDTEQQKESHPVIRGLLDHPASEVKQKAIEMLAKTGDKTVLPRIEELLRDPHLGVRTEALLYLAHFSHIDPLEHIQLGDFPDFSIRSAVAAFLSRQGPSQSLEAAYEILNIMVNDAGPEGRENREEAARLLVVFPDCFDEQLKKLLADPEPEVVIHAIRAVGKHRKRQLVHDVLHRLPDPKLRDESVEALAQFGDTIVGMLSDHISDPAEAMDVRREIPAVLLRIGTASVGRALMENILEPDNTLRFRTIAALNKLQQTPSAMSLDLELMDTALQAEIMGHYRSYQILGMLQERPDQDDPIMRGLRESMREEVERIFRLMSLMHPHLDLHSAYVGLQSKDRIVHDNALEFLDNILKQQMRSLLVPLIDGEITLAERIRLANHLLHTDVVTKEQAVKALVSSEDPWLRACGAYAIGSLGLTALKRELDSCLDHPDPLLRETARQAQLRLAARA